MKKEIYKWLNICLIPVKLAMVVAMVFFSYEGLNKVFYNHNVVTGDSYRSLPENMVDVLVLGSSDSQYSFIPSFFCDDTGLTSYVRGTACQPLKVSYEMLKDSLKTQNPKLLILEVFTSMPLKETCMEDSCFVIAQYQMSGDEKYNTISYLPEEKASAYYNDFFNYHNDWRELEDPLSAINDLFAKKDRNIDYTFGYIYQSDPYEDPPNWWYPNTYPEFADVELDEEDLTALDSIYELCSSKGIEILLYKTPIDGITVEDQSYLYKVWEWADEHNIRYYDFVDHSPDIDFFMQLNSDSFHCYLSGANIITTKLGEIVNDYYDLESVHEEYVTKMYHDEISWYTGELMQGDRNGERWFDRLMKAPGYILIDYKAGSGISDSMYETLIEKGCSRFDRSEDYKAIIKDGVSLCEGNGAVEIEVDGVAVRVGSRSMHIGDEDYELNGLLSFGYTNSKNFGHCYFSSMYHTDDGWRTLNFHY